MSGGEQYYHRRRRQRQRKQAEQARQHEQDEQARQREATATTTASNADKSSTCGSSISATTCVHTDSSQSNHMQSQHHRRVSNSHHQRDTHENRTMPQRAGIKSSSTKTTNSATESINPSTLVHCAGQELHFIRSRTALSPGQKFFTMTSTQQLIPCTISSSTTHECKKGKKAIKYEIILDKHRAIKNNVDHSRLRILHHKPTPTLSDANTKQPSSTSMSASMFMNTLRPKVKHSTNDMESISRQRDLIPTPSYAKRHQSSKCTDTKTYPRRQPTNN